MQHDDGGEPFALGAHGQGQGRGDLMVAGIDGDILLGIGLFGGFSRGEGAARDDHSQRQEQRQKLAHRNTPPVSYCAFAQKVL